MYPRLFTIGPITVYSFGLMMGLGFFVASIILHKESVRKNLVFDFSAELLRFLRASYSIVLSALLLSYLIELGAGEFFTLLETNFIRTVVILAGIVILGYVLFSAKSRVWVTADTAAFIVVTSIIAGVIGSKALYVVENISYVSRAPFDMIFSPGGLTWYGGFTLVTVLVFYFTKKKHVSFLQICDAASPSLLIGYAIARIGCHLAGDGDYGMPTDLPWASVYSNGTYPPSVAFRDFPEIVRQYGINGVVPDTIAVHPAPLYEFFAGVLLFAIVWKFRRSFKRAGEMFTVYLILAGASRLAVEFIRLNPRILFGLTEAQLFSIVMILAGAIGLVIVKKQQRLHQAHETTE